MRRTFFAPPLTTTWPSVTWPSPPSATLAPRRTERMVVPWNCSMGNCLDGDATAGCQQQDYEPQRRHATHDERSRRQIGQERYRQTDRVAHRAERISASQAMASKIARRQRGNDERCEHEVDAHELHRDRHRTGEEQIEADAAEAARPREPDAEDGSIDERDIRQQR